MAGYGDMSGFGQPAGFAVPPSTSMFDFRPPTYNPFGGGPALLQNPMAQLAMASFLPQMMGQGQFLPSLAPAQHLFDQANAAKFQSARMEGAGNPRRLDQAAVATRLLGIRAMGTDAPPTPLNIEQASMGAGVLNNPFTKMLLGSVMGPENMEDMFYGRRGSAEMMYQSVAQTGFHRRDPATGGQTMSGASMGAVSREMYEQMYGEGADLGAMNGLSAGRAGVLYQDLHRRGLLPQSIGNLSASDRVKAVAEGRPRDDKTVTRLAREYAHEEMMRDDEEYQKMTAPAQEARVEERLGHYKGKLTSQFEEIDRYNAGQKGADGKRKSINEIEQMEGFGAAARNIDATKISGALKNYSGAVAAIREIFGENGNTNAPMQQLMLGLEALTQNSMGQMSPGKVEDFVRRAQMASRDSGIGLQAMLGISGQLGAYGDTLGLNRSFAGQNTVNAMNTVTAMRNNGMFEAGFNRMTPEQAALKTGQMAQAADASNIGNRMASAARAVAENPEAFKGTELEAFVNAYNRGETKYTYDGKEVDVVEQIGQTHGQFANQLMEQAGMTKGQIQMQNLNRAENQEFLKAGYARMGHRGIVANGIATHFEGLTKDAGMDPAMTAEFSKEMAGAVIDDIDNSMAPEDRVKTMQRRSKEILADMAKRNIAAERRAAGESELSEKDLAQAAETRASEQYESIFGGDPKKAALRMQHYLNNANAVGGAVGKMPLESLRQMLREGVQQGTEETGIQQQNRAEAMRHFGDTQSNIVQRASDVLGALGSGDTSVRNNAMSHILGAVDKSKLEGAMRPGAEEMMRLSGEEFTKSVETTTSEVNNLVEKAKEKDPAAISRLQELAGDKDKKITDVAELERLARRKENKVIKGREGQTKRAGALLRSVNEGGSGGAAIGSRAIAESMLGEDATEEQIQQFADSIYAGGEGFEKAVGGFAPEQQTRIRKMQAAIQEMKTGRSLGTNAGLDAAKARQKAAQEIVAASDPKELAKTEEGRRLIAQASAKDDGAYTYKDKEGKTQTGNVQKDLADISTEGSAKFKTDVETATKSQSDEAKKKTREAMGEAAVETAAAQATAAESGGGGAKQENVQTINIGRVENLVVQNATGLKSTDSPANAGASGKAPSADAVAAGVDAQKGKRTGALRDAYDTAMKKLGEAATNANVGMRALIDDPTGTLANVMAGITGAGSPDAAKEAETAVQTAQKTAGAVVAAENPKVTAAKKEFEEAENQRLTAWANLSPAEKAEFEYYNDIQKSKDLRNKLNDPKTTPAERERIRDEIENADDNLKFAPEEVVAKRMAEDAGVDVSGNFSLDMTLDRVAVNGVELNPRKFYSQVNDIKQNADTHGDVLSDKSRSYALAEIESRQKERAIKHAAQESIADTNKDQRRDLTRQQTQTAAQIDQAAQKDPSRIELLATQRGMPVGGGNTEHGYASKSNYMRAHPEKFGENPWFDSVYEQKDAAGTAKHIFKSGDKFYQEHYDNLGERQFHEVELTEKERQQIDRIDAENDAAREAQKAGEQKQTKTEEKAERKKEESVAAVPPVEERRAKQREEEMADTIKLVNNVQMSTGALYSANVGGMGGSGSGGEQSLTGTLQLRGLTEAFLSASTKQMEQTPDGGPAVDMANATAAYVGGAAQPAGGRA